MNITTNSGNTYSYIRSTNEIVCGISEEQGYKWNFAPRTFFKSMPEVHLFIIGITEQCNLRCTYCCYSGQYENNRTHSNKFLDSNDIDAIFVFISHFTKKKNLHIAFYGGEPLLQYPLIQYMVVKGHELFGDDLIYSITTNATLLTPDKVDWLMSHHVEMVISVDGTRSFHDKHRLFANGEGSFDKVRDALSYIRATYPNRQELVTLQITLPNFRDIEFIAEEWHNDSLLKDFEPCKINALAANFLQGVERMDYDEERKFYSHLIDVYEKHQNWAVLKTFFEERVDLWKNRPILDAGDLVPMATCMPVNTKLFIDAGMHIGVCEKIADKYRIGNIKDGIDWEKANALAQEYYDRRYDLCKNCPVVRMCELCLTAIEFDSKQWETLCHNEQTYARVLMFVFCEMAERGLIR